MLTAYLISQVLTYTYTYTFWVSSKHIAYCLPHFLGKQYAICLLLTSKVYVYVSSKHAYLRYSLATRESDYIVSLSIRVSARNHYEPKRVILIASNRFKADFFVFLRVYQKFALQLLEITEQIPSSY